MNNITIKLNSVLILEIYKYHYECTPGFTKYFIDLGFNVDILIHKMGISSFCFFEPKRKIRLFYYEDSEYLLKNKYLFSSICEKYDFRFVETTELNNYKWNPHYFGEFDSRKKNRITTFFITSTIYRNYSKLIQAAEKMKEENAKFRVIVIGKIKTFSIIDIPKKLKNNFIFKYQVSYSELYKNVYNSDYIIINLDPNLKQDLIFSNIRATGSAQLSYGFLKPVLINDFFSKFYNFDDSNSIIYDDYNFTEAMRRAINIKNNNYEKIKQNLSLLANKIYVESLFNLENCLFYSW